MPALKIGQRVFDEPPQVALTVSDQEPNDRLAGCGVDLLEVRADLFAQTDVDYMTQQLARRAQVGLPLLLTVRNDPEEGGQADMPDEAKWAILEAAIDAVDAVDIELSSSLAAQTIDLAHKRHKKVIVSYHNFTDTPDAQVLAGVVHAARHQGADVVKLATMPSSRKDVQRMAALTAREADKPIVTLCMGALGAISRVLFPALGSVWTYTCLDQPVAPGQIPWVQLREDLARFYP